MDTTLNDLRGTFELHNTIALTNQDESRDFIEFCQLNKLKPIQVLILYNEEYLSTDHFEHLRVRGNTDKLIFKNYEPVILYQTAKYFVGYLHHAFDELKRITQLLIESDYCVIREKIEAVRSTIDLDKLKDREECYHETHIVVNCSNYTEQNIHILDKLNKIANQNNISINNLYVPLSFNLKKYEDNQVFITLRNYLVDLKNVGLEEIIDKTKKQIKEKFEIIKTINETVVFDSNSYIDCQKF
ncbi:hypothetical protein Klosneuvirus_2_271 [Klosneuvirus KNV1]|uniref:Uncharacterized protein n=1 Tax=Klosneuvirus KNV1 TaxID=1977640 RepID=A0A1V0SJD9_9VIRU|nr:hypothetical protein Klosneuvirus_2_271 [Klosneuvirus KNV1]